MITSPAGAVLLRQTWELFVALAELDKHAPAEVNEILSAMVAHVRSYRPQALLVAEVSNG